MKKQILFLAISFLVSSLFAFDRDYSKIQQEHLKADAQKFLFRDVFGKEFWTFINPAVKKNPYKPECFVHEGDNVYYRGDKKYVSKMGVDISRHDGEVDWKKLKDSGIEFVILRIGYRGYQSGKAKVDENFHKNIKGALSAGLEIGVYFFSQAADENEAVEEADIVIKELKKYKITLPVFYDPEIIRDDAARSDNITGEQFTKNAIVFCNKVSKAGFIPGVYCNMLWQAYEFDLSKFDDFVIWYADYEKVPQSPYRFTFWQYAEKEGEANAPYDMDIMMILQDSAL